MDNTASQQTNSTLQPSNLPLDQKKVGFPKKPYLVMVVILFLTICIGMGIGFFLSTKDIKMQNKSVKSEVRPPANSPGISPPPSPTNIFKSSIPSDPLPRIGPCMIFPADNPWNQDISKLPVSPLSNYYISSMGLNKNLHPDFGGASYGSLWGIPFMTVTNKDKLYPVNFTAYGGESDPGPYPVPLTAPIEGGTEAIGDRHVLVVNTDTCKLYEMYRAFPTQTGWNADSGAVFDLSSNSLRPERWTSADAAGLPIFPGLIKYEEVAKGSVNHAIRFTTGKTQRAYIAPARHYASSSTDPHLPPMGLRVRLKTNYNIDNLTPQAKVIAFAMKKYGLILADNGGDWFFQGEATKLWNDEDINTLKSIPGSAFEAVDTGSPVQ